MKLKSPIVIQAEINHINNSIEELVKKLNTIEDEEVIKVCLLSLNELKVRRSALEWIFK
jgi:hypothetical protein